MNSHSAAVKMAVAFFTLATMSSAQLQETSGSFRPFTNAVDDTAKKLEVTEPNNGRSLVDCNIPNPFPVSAFSTTLHPVILCDILQAFDKTGRDENDKTTPLDWSSLCKDFEPVSSYLCPDQLSLTNICDHPHPQLNPAVKLNYCEPLFAVIADATTQAKCVRACINYVSQDEGGCCDIACT